jgi:L-fucose isomerase-like protein
MAGKRLVLTVCARQELRSDWPADLAGPTFDAFCASLEAELATFGIDFAVVQNDAIVITVNSYADLLNAVRVSSPADGLTNKCVGHIIGKSQHLDLLEDIKRAVNRVAFAPETVPPDDHNRKVCHNCGCGC